MMDVLFRLMFIGIVAAFREHSQLPVGKVSIEGHALFRVKEKAPVRIEHQRRADDMGQEISKVKNIPAIGPAVPSELIVKWFSAIFSVPLDQLFFELGF